MHKPESVPEKETHWIIVIQTDHLIPTRRPGLELINKKLKNFSSVDFVVPVNQTVKILDKYLNLQRAEKAG